MNKISSITLKNVDDRTIVGFDPGYRHIGWAVGAIRNKEAYITHHGTIVLPEEVMGKHERDERRKYDRFLSPEAMFYLGQQTNNVMHNSHVTDVVYERLFIGKNVQSVVGVYEVCGMIKLLAANNKAMVYQYTPQVIKKSATGDKFAKKDQVINMVKQLTGVHPDTDHCADAIACVIAHCLHLRGEHLK